MIYLSSQLRLVVYETCPSNVYMMTKEQACPSRFSSPVLINNIKKQRTK